MGIVGRRRVWSGAVATEPGESVRPKKSEGKREQVPERGEKGFREEVF